MHSMEFLLNNYVQQVASVHMIFTKLRATFVASKSDRTSNKSNSFIEFTL